MAVMAGRPLCLTSQPTLHMSAPRGATKPCIHYFHSAAWQPAPQAPVHRRRQLAAVAAASRQAGGRRLGKKARKQDEAAVFEELMFDWDSTFEAFCEDTDKAVQLARLADEGYRQHGRGFVFLRSKLDKRRRRAPSGGGAAKGFGAAPKPAAQGVPLPNEPSLHLLSWSACFVAGSLLSGLGGVFTAEGGVQLPDSAGLLMGDAGSDGGGGGEAAALVELRRVLRGQDLALLLTYTGEVTLNWSAGAGQAEGADADAAAAATGGSQPASSMLVESLRPYQPEGGELVVLLAAKVNGTPAVGAELLAVVRREDGSTALVLPGDEEQVSAAAGWAPGGALA